MSDKPFLHAAGKSDSPVVPAKAPKQRGQTLGGRAGGKRADRGERRQLTHGPHAEAEGRVPGAGRRAASREEGQAAAFHRLLHHITEDLLRRSFYSLKKEAAAGVDEVTWQEYEIGLEDRLIDLHNRVHRGVYRAQPA